MKTPLPLNSEDLTNKARTVLFSLKSYTNSLNNLPVNVACNLFDTIVKPIASFNSDVTFMDIYCSIYRAKQRSNISGRQIDYLSFTDKTCMEKLHLSFYKYILGTKNKFFKSGC